MTQCCGSCPLPALCDDPQASGLSGALLDSVRDQRQLAPGAALYQAGQKRCSIWVISTGALKTCELDLDGREQVVGFHVAGEVLGIERIEVPAHRGFAVALEPTRLCRVPLSRLLARLGSVPELWRDVLGIAGRQIAQARRMHRVLGQLQSGQRVAWFLLEGPGLERSRCECSGEWVVHLPMQRQDIASFLGMTLETVSRSFSALHRERLITVDGRVIRILNPARLAARALPGSHCDEMPEMPFGPPQGRVSRSPRRACLKAVAP
jgi:CRP/FNR family transcriptional regulator, anaerobic regulatory protein